MTDKERKSCIRTIELLMRLAFNVHGVMDVIDAQNCDKIIEMLNKPEPHWIPCSERLPDEDHWLGGSGKQFSDEVLVSVSNSADEDVYVYVSQTLDGKWNLELPEYYEVIAWMPLPEPYQPEEESK